MCIFEVTACPVLDHSAITCVLRSSVETTTVYWDSLIENQFTYRYTRYGDTLQSQLLSFRHAHLFMGACWNEMGTPAAPTHHYHLIHLKFNLLEHEYTNEIFKNHQVNTVAGGATGGGDREKTNHYRISRPLFAMEIFQFWWR